MRLADAEKGGEAGIKVSGNVITLFLAGGPCAETRDKRSDEGNSDLMKVYDCVR